MRTILFYENQHYLIKYFRRNNVKRSSLSFQNICIYGAQIYTTYYIYVYLHESIYLNRTKQILEYRKETFDNQGMSTINGTVIIGA